MLCCFCMISEPSPFFFLFVLELCCVIIISKCLSRSSKRQETLPSMSKLLQALCLCQKISLWPLSQFLLLSVRRFFPMSIFTFIPTQQNCFQACSSCSLHSRTAHVGALPLHVGCFSVLFKSTKLLQRMSSSITHSDMQGGGLMLELAGFIFRICF